MSDPPTDLPAEPLSADWYTPVSPQETTAGPATPPRPSKQTSPPTTRAPSPSVAPVSPLDINIPSAPSSTPTARGVCVKGLSPRTRGLIRWLQRQPITPSALRDVIQSDEGDLDDDEGQGAPEGSEKLVDVHEMAQARATAAAAFNTPPPAEGPLRPESVQERNYEWIVVEQEDRLGNTTRFRELINTNFGTTTPSRHSPATFQPWRNNEDDRIATPIPSPSQQRALRLRTPPQHRGLGAAAAAPGSPSPSPAQKATQLAASASDDISTILQSSSPDDALDGGVLTSKAGQLLAQVTSAGGEASSASTFVSPIPLLPPAVTTPTAKTPHCRASDSGDRISSSDTSCPCHDCAVLGVNDKSSDRDDQPISEEAHLTVTGAEEIAQVYHDTYNPHPARVARKTMQKWAHRRDTLIVHFFLLGKARAVYKEDLYRRALTRAEQDARYPRYVAGIFHNIDSPPRRQSRATIGRGTPPTCSRSPLVRPPSSSLLAPDDNLTRARLALVSSPGASSYTQRSVSLPPGSSSSSAESWRVARAMSTDQETGTESCAQVNPSSVTMTRSASADSIPRFRDLRRSQPVAGVDRPPYASRALSTRSPNSRTRPQPVAPKVLYSRKPRKSNRRDTLEVMTGVTATPSITPPSRVVPTDDDHVEESRSTQRSATRLSGDELVRDNSDTKLVDDKLEEPVEFEFEHTIPEQAIDLDEDLSDDTDSPPPRTPPATTYRTADNSASSLFFEDSADRSSHASTGSPSEPILDVSWSRPLPKRPKPAEDTAATVMQRKLSSRSDEARPALKATGAEEEDDGPAKDIADDRHIPDREAAIAIHITPSSPDLSDATSSDIRAKAESTGNPVLAHILEDDGRPEEAAGEHDAAIRVREEAHMPSIGGSAISVHDVGQTDSALVESMFQDQDDQSKGAANDLDAAETLLDESRLAIIDAIYRTIREQRTEAAISQSFRAKPARDSPKSSTDSSSSSTARPTSSMTVRDEQEATPLQRSIGDMQGPDDTPDSVEIEQLVTPHLPMRPDSRATSLARVLPFGSQLSEAANDEEESAGGKRFTRAEKGKGRAVPVSDTAQETLGESSGPEPSDPGVSMTRATFTALAGPLKLQSADPPRAGASYARAAHKRKNATSISSGPSPERSESPGPRRSTIVMCMPYGTGSFTPFDRMSVEELEEAEIVAVTTVSRLEMRHKELTDLQSCGGEGSNALQAYGEELGALTKTIAEWNTRMTRIAENMKERIDRPFTPLRSGSSTSQVVGRETPGLRTRPSAREGHAPLGAVPMVRDSPHSPITTLTPGRQEVPILRSSPRSFLPDLAAMTPPHEDGSLRAEDGISMQMTADEMLARSLQAEFDQEWTGVRQDAIISRDWQGVSLEHRDTPATGADLRDMGFTSDYPATRNASGPLLPPVGLDIDLDLDLGEDEPGEMSLVIPPVNPAQSGDGEDEVPMLDMSDTIPQNLASRLTVSPDRAVPRSRGTRSASPSDFAGSTQSRFALDSADVLGAARAPSAPGYLLLPAFSAGPDRRCTEPWTSGPLATNEGELGNEAKKSAGIQSPVGLSTSSVQTLSRLSARSDDETNHFQGSSADISESPRGSVNTQTYPIVGTQAHKSPSPVPNRSSVDSDRPQLGGRHELDDLRNAPQIYTSEGTCTPPANDGPDPAFRWIEMPDPRPGSDRNMPVPRNMRSWFVAHMEPMNDPSRPDQIAPLQPVGLSSLFPACTPPGSPERLNDDITNLPLPKHGEKGAGIGPRARRLSDVLGQEGGPDIYITPPTPAPSTILDGLTPKARPGRKISDAGLKAALPIISDESGNSSSSSSEDEAGALFFSGTARKPKSASLSDPGDDEEHSLIASPACATGCSEGCSSTITDQEMLEEQNTEDRGVMSPAKKAASKLQAMMGAASPPMRRSKSTGTPSSEAKAPSRPVSFSEALHRLNERFKRQDAADDTEVEVVRGPNKLKRPGMSRRGASDQTNLPTMTGGVGSAIKPARSSVELDRRDCADEPDREEDKENERGVETRSTFDQSDHSEGQELAQSPGWNGTATAPNNSEPAPAASRGRSRKSEIRLCDPDPAGAGAAYRENLAEARDSRSHSLAGPVPLAEHWTIDSPPPFETRSPLTARFRNSEEEFEYHLDVIERQAILAELDGRVSLPEGLDLQQLRRARRRRGDWDHGDEEDGIGGPTMEVVRVRRDTAQTQAYGTGWAVEEEAERQEPVGLETEDEMPPLTAAELRAAIDFMIAAFHVIMLLGMAWYVFEDGLGGLLDTANRLSNGT